MSFALFLDLLASWWGLASVIFFSIGVLRLTDESVKMIASSFYDSGEQVAVELAQQKVDFQFGAALLFVSFLAQLTTKLFPILQSTILIGQFWLAVGLSFLLAAASMGACALHAARLRKKAEAKARAFNK